MIRETPCLTEASMSAFAWASSFAGISPPSPGIPVFRSIGQNWEAKQAHTDDEDAPDGCTNLVEKFC